MRVLIALALLLVSTPPGPILAATPGVRAAAPAGTAPGAQPAPDLRPYFAGLPGTFVLLDGRTGRIFRHDPERARARVVPASTFKIPNSLIALETGVASGPDFPLRWDPKVAPREPWWPATWARDQTMRTALPESVVWYYQELARRTGPRRMQEYVRRFHYGNQDISGGIDRFWLGGGLRISAEEQVDFLRRFHEGKLGVSERSARIVRDLLVLEQTPAYRLSGKTGTGRIAPGRQTGWLVGYVERGAETSYFAFRVEGEGIFESWPKARRVEAVRGILARLGVLPPTAGPAPGR